MTNKIYVDDIGVDIIVDCGEDISTADPIALLYRKPDGTTGTWTPEIYADNYLKYTVKDGDLAQAGKYRVQASLTLGDWTGKGESATFTVYEAFG